MMKLLLVALISGVIGYGLGYILNTYKGKSAKHWFNTSVIVFDEVKRADEFRACVKKAFDNEDYNDIKFCIENDEKK